MPQVVPQQLFSSAAAHYARYRSGYPRAAVADLAQRLRLDRSRTVADIGCGTGQLALALAEHAAAVVAIDPLAEMLTLGAAAAQAAGLANVTWVQGDSAELDALLPPGVFAATFAASFHWTDRLAVTRALDRVLPADGAIVVINDILGDDEQPAWTGAIDAVRDRYLSPAADIAAYTRPRESHRDVLSASPFAHIDALTWEWERKLTVDEVVGLQLTYSVSTPERLGTQAAAFAAEVRHVVLDQYPDGVVAEPFRVEVLIARR
ncbi:MAG TPA: class I SAM-dependent methyltransferase [Streptosporangiaceae bacterium]|jgi:ubiquinone/menaquinone biosynthesis C-methylase UbiE